MLANMYKPWLDGMLLIAGCILGALLLHTVAYAILSRIQRKKKEAQPQSVSLSWIRTTRGPVLLLLLLSALAATLPLTSIPRDVLSLTHHGILLIFIGGTAWLLISLLSVLHEIVTNRYRTDINDNLTARRIHTQMLVINRVAASIIIVLAIALMMMTFPQVWSLGAGIFASAGIAGIVAGTAAKGVFSNLLAGIQIGLTQPIRIDDVVVVQGQWGRIEEIGTAFVTVRIWDLRRLIVPLNYFIEQPFENWTTRAADLLGTIFLYVDYTVPVDPIRKELARLLELDARWDKKVVLLQVTDATAQTIELRALISAADSGSLFDLRCAIREGLIDFIAKNYPGSLPRVRQENLIHQFETHEEPNSHAHALHSPRRQSG